MAAHPCAARAPRFFEVPTRDREICRASTASCLFQTGAKRRQEHQAIATARTNVVAPPPTTPTRSKLSGGQPSRPDVFLVRREGKKDVLIPDIDPVIANIDLQKGEIRVNLLPGLISDEEL